MGRPRFTEEQIRTIRARYAAGETQRELGQAFGVTSVAIHKIVTRDIYRWVP